MVRDGLGLSGMVDEKVMLKWWRHNLLNREFQFFGPPTH
jgi:hypothetical protein